MNDVETIARIRKAVKDGDVPALDALIGSDHVVLNRMSAFGSWLHLAATYGKLNVVEYLAERGFDVNLRGGLSDGTAINRAASKGHADIVRYLFERGATLEVSELERNPLFSAIYGGHLEIVKLLLDLGMDFRIQYSNELLNNLDASAFARACGQTEIAAYLASLSQEGDAPE